MRYTNLMAGLLMMSGVAMAAQADLTILLCDHVGLTPLELSSAKRLAVSLIAKAGIRVRFAQCGEPADVREIRMSIENKVPERSRGALGYALPYTERANQATLNYQRIVKTSPARPEMLLGVVIAHELGHLLFRSGEHGEGLMKAMWTPADVRAMSENRIVFSAEQAAGLRAGFEARVAGTLLASAR